MDGGRRGGDGRGGPSWTAADTNASIPARFARLLKDRARHPAIVGAEHEFTYGELDALSGAYLVACRDRGWPLHGGRAALLMRHDGPLLAAALAILRGAGAIVTLNPTDPPGRLAELREAIEPHVLVTEPHLIERALAAGFSDAAIVSSPAGDPGEAVADAAVQPDALAFLICTSGTSGRPKVVMQTHRNMLHNILRYTNGLGVTPDERIAWLASLSGGQGIVTAWCGLMNGATLCPFPIAERGFIGLADWVEQRRITLFDALPSILRSLDRSLPADRTIAGVRLVRLGSEPALREDFEAFKRRFGPSSMVASVFGSSEAGTMAQMLIAPGDTIAGERLPVGQVTDGIDIRLLDEDGDCVPDGPGEIVVYGDYLSPGYWGDERLTAARFATADGRRCYRSGDLARRDEHGALTVIGRTDRQVKVHGYALQLEEVEAALAQQPGVAAAAVTSQGHDGGDVSLTAYVSGRPGTSLSAAELRRALRSRLPSHAIPGEFVVLEELPLNSNGKVDTTQLSRRSDTVAIVTGIWERALERQALDVERSLLDIGGDSLIAAVIAAEVHERFGVEFGLGAFDEEMSVVRMAAVIDGHVDPQPHAAQLPAPRRESGARTAPLSYAQETIWRQASEKGAGFNGSAGFRIRGPLDLTALRRSLSQIVRRHEILRTGFELRDGEPSAVVHPAVEPELPLVDLSGDPDGERRALELLAADARTPFELHAAPLLRLRLVRLRPDEHWLLRTIHHIVSDAPSWRIFIAELAAIYPAVSQGLESPLPDELPLQMGDYARWERCWIGDEAAAYRTELDWWQPRLDPRPPQIKLPFLRPTPAGDDRSGLVDVICPAAVTGLLDQLGRRLGATYFMSRLALFTAFVSLETGATDMAIDTFVTLRRRSELQSIFGPLINRAVIRLRYADDVSLSAWIAVVRLEVVELSGYGQVPFDLLIRELQASGVRHPLLGTKFQVDEEPPLTRFGGLEVEPLPRDPVAPWRFTLFVKRLASGERWRAVFDALHDPVGAEAFLIRMRALAVTACAEPQRSLRELHAALAQPAPNE
jgi:acyl-CoA synthetase (AMP-forming)/AMP-acid ligase II